MHSPLLRLIPQVDRLLSMPALKAAAARYTHAAAVFSARAELNELRTAILEGRMQEIPGDDALCAQIAARMQKDARKGLARVINATGVLLHTNFGRAPLGLAAAQAAFDAARGYTSLEYSVEEGGRGSRHAHCASLLSMLTGAEDALVVNNNAAAVLLMLSALARGKEVVLSRGELVEIGGAFRMPDVMAQALCTLKEVGTTNKTRAGDIMRAIDPEKTGALMKVHTSNYRIVGFTQEVSLAEMAEIGRRFGLPVLYDLGSGCLDRRLFPYPKDEPSVVESVRAGADVVCLSGDKLLGGPQAGILLGRRAYIAKMKAHPLLRALRVDKMTLAALEATLRIYLEPERARREIPVLQMLSMDADALREKAERLMAMADTPGRLCVVAVEGRVGGGSAPLCIIPSFAVAVENAPAQALARRLRAFDTPVIARIEKDRLLFDVLTVEEEELGYTASCLKQALEEDTCGMLS